MLAQARASLLTYMQPIWLTNTQVAEIEDSGQQTLTKEQEVTRLLLPVLQAQSMGERRWCGWVLGTYP